MRWLPKLFNSINPRLINNRERTNTPELVQEQQTKALTQIGKSLNELSAFVTQGGLTNLVKDYSQAQIAKGVLEGLAAHDGRNALDARFIKQNALEIVHAIEAVFDKVQDRREAASKEELDHELKNAENEFNQWRMKNHGS